MNRIVAINASPKTKESVSGALIVKMEEILDTKIGVYQTARLLQQEKISETIADLLNADVMLIVFPLYVDSLPTPLIKLLTLIEQTAKDTNSPPPVVYAICNCGFYEAEHTGLALRMLRHFTRRAGLVWGYGIGVGGGGLMLSPSQNMKNGPTANVYAALCVLGKTIRDGEKGPAPDVFVTPKIPRFLYKIGGHVGWRHMAKKNGVKNSLHARPHSL